jgi:4-amino-4-deoxy-L-arabinose transferase-like glycosyltransferase
LLLVPILLAYGYIAVGYARGTPRWNNPDEPAHVNVIRQIAMTGTLPVLSEGDWDQALLDRLRTAWFPNDYEVDRIRYEGHQPPLYYLLAAPIHRLTAWMPLNRQILVLRLFSIAIGSLTVVAAFVAAREAAPDLPVLAVLTAATVAFVPMNTAISAAVNNDCLASALAGLTLAALMVGRRRGFSERWAVGLGVLIGALVLTKLTVYVFVPLILVTLFIAGRSPLPEGEGVGSLSLWERAGVRARSLRWPAIAAGVGLLICGWWLVHNMLLYGPFDPLAMTRHDQIVVGQPRWTAYDLEAFDFFFRILFRSFWGVFGWMGVVLDDGFYILYLVLTLLGLAGLALTPTREALTPRPPLPAVGEGGPTREPRPGSPSPAHRDVGPQGRPTTGPLPRGTADVRAAQRLGRGSLKHRDLLGWATLLVFGEVTYYNLTFIQPQGRSLFPALVPIALFLSSGWLRLASGATRGPLVRLLTAGVLAGAIAWGLGEAAGTIAVANSALRTADSTVRAQHYWSDGTLIATAAVGALIVLVAPRAARALLPVGLALLLAVALGLLDVAALVEFVVPGFPLR